MADLAVSPPSALDQRRARPRRRAAAVVGVGAVVLLAVATVVVARTPRTPSDVAITPVAFSLADVRDPLAPVDFRPGVSRAPTVINFFGSWCEPCRKELPDLAAARANHPEVVFIGVDHTDGREPARDMLAEFKITYPAGYDPSGSVAATFGLRGMPSTVFVSADGSRAEVHRGRLTAEEIERRIARLTLQAGRS